MQNIKIHDAIFESSYKDGAYSKAELVSLLNQIVSPESLNEMDQTVIGGVLFGINDNGVKNLNIIELMKSIAANKTNASKSLIAKIYTNQDIRKQLDDYNSSKRKENRKWIIGFMLVLTLVVLFLAYKFNYIKFPVSPAKEGAKVVVLDTARLAYSATAPYMNVELTPDQAQRISLSYRDNLQKQIKKYIDNGYIIIHRSNVYATSEANDITDKLIKDLGLKSVDRERFDADYTNQQKYNVLKNFAQLNVGDYEKSATDDANKTLNEQAEKQLNSAEVITNGQGQSIDLE